MISTISIQLLMVFTLGLTIRSQCDLLHSLNNIENESFIFRENAKMLIANPRVEVKVMFTINTSGRFRVPLRSAFVNNPTYCFSNTIRLYLFNYNHSNQIISVASVKRFRMYAKFEYNRTFFPSYSSNIKLYYIL